DDEEKAECLACLAKIGPAAKLALPAVEKELQSQSMIVRVNAACTLLSLAPPNRRAIVVLKDGLTNKNKIGVKGPLLSACEKEVRELALEAWPAAGPQSETLVRLLLPLLEDDTEQIRIMATYALGQMGAGAADAIESIEKLLMKQDDHMK